MKKFVVLYSGGKAPTTPQEGEASMKKWNAWFSKLGSAVVEAGAPFGGSMTLSGSATQEGPGGNLSNGYSIVQANDVAAAAKLLKACPILADGGKVHVFDLREM